MLGLLVKPEHANICGLILTLVTGMLPFVVCDAVVTFNRVVVRRFKRAEITLEFLICMNSFDMSASRPRIVKYLITLSAFVFRLYF
mgnify:FL=1